MVNPVIIIGMHRSGTSMVSRALDDLGLFTGRRKQRDNESLFFLDLNNWLMLQCGGSWDHPQPTRELLQHGQARSLAADYIRFLMRTPRLTGFLGWRNYLRYRKIGNLDFPWGWKDPRNTYTLPLWLDIFPDARIIHIYRHGVDVANSLYIREQARFSGRSHPVRHPYKRLLYVVRPKKGGFADSLRCAALEGGFSLWEEYVGVARSHVRKLGDRALELKYEDFLADPHAALLRLTTFCGLAADPAGIDAAASLVTKSRAYAYRNRPELEEFSLRASARLKVYGY